LSEKKHEQLFLDPEFFQALHNKHLLLDTSFFGDYASHPTLLIEFVENCKKNDVILATTMPVVTEFTGGSDTPVIYKSKIELVKSVTEYFLPISANVFQTAVPWLTEQYGQIGKAISMTDFMLAALINIHPDLCLLTKNPQDFPTSVFKVKTYFLLQLERALQVYGVYCFEQSTATQVSGDIPF